MLRVLSRGVVGLLGLEPQTSQAESWGVNLRLRQADLAQQPLKARIRAQGVETGLGKVLRVTDNGLEEIATGLFLSTALTFGPDGALYVSNVGFGPPPVGLGQIVRITVPPVGQ